MENYASNKGGFTKTIEEQTAKAPSDIYLWAAAGTALLALGCLIGGKKFRGALLRQLASPLLVIGLFKKLISTGGDDKANKGQKAESAKSMNQGVFQHQE